MVPARRHSASDAATSAIERALSLNASCATALYMGAHIYAFRGNPVVATAHAERAPRLSPFDPLLYEAHLALALASLQAERYDEAGFSTLYFFNAMGAGAGGTC
jgi:adenylate cyclase